MFFAPGAVYPILPLWVEEPEGQGLAECEGTFLLNWTNGRNRGQ